MFSYIKIYKTMRRGGESCCGSLCWGHLALFRTKLRTALRIKGSIIGDFCAISFCKSLIYTYGLFDCIIQLLILQAHVVQQCRCLWNSINLMNQKSLQNRIKETNNNVQDFKHVCVNKQPLRRQSSTKHRFYKERKQSQ